MTSMTIGDVRRAGTLSQLPGASPAKMHSRTFLERSPGRPSRTPGEFRRLGADRSLGVDGPLIGFINSVSRSLTPERPSDLSQPDVSASYRRWRRLANIFLHARCS